MENDEIVLRVLLTEEQEQDVSSYLKLLHDAFPERKFFVWDVLNDFIEDGLRKLHDFFSLKGK